MKKIWDDEAWGDYLSWQETDLKILKRINDLLKDTERDPFHGIGKPEPLRHDLSGLWSRRIDGKHRLVYRVRDGKLEIVSCRDHYKD